ncbi:MAG: hypothetical protein AAF960_23885 [Bacteroidota bacterium]
MEKAKNNIKESEVKAGRDVTIGDTNTNITIKATVSTIVLVAAIAIVVTLFTPYKLSLSLFYDTATPHSIKKKTEVEGESTDKTIRSPASINDRNDAQREKVSTTHQNIQQKRPSRPKPTATYFLGGRLQDFTTKEPLAGIQISCQGRTVETDDAGNFHLPIERLSKTKDVLVTYQGQGYYDTQLYANPQKDNLLSDEVEIKCAIIRRYFFF